MQGNYSTFSDRSKEVILVGLSLVVWVEDDRHAHRIFGSCCAFGHHKVLLQCQRHVVKLFECAIAWWKNCSDAHWATGFALE